MEKLTDESSMPFGEYKGEKMETVPASYFNWLWHNGMKSERSNVADYIRENMTAFETENTDLIW